MKARVPLAALAVLLLLPVPAAPQAATVVQWWGPTDIGQGFHLRIPATATNTRDHAVDDLVVLAEVDIAAALSSAGWTRSPSGDRDLLRGFRLDPDSVRVVAMTDLQAPVPGTTHGRLKAVSDHPPGDLRRFEVPSIHFQGPLTQEGPEFDAAVNPFITVAWRVPGQLAAGGQRHFMIYFDTDLTNPAKDPPSYAGTLAAANVENLFWSGAGTTLYGFVRPLTGQVGSVQVFASHADTHVQVYTAAPEGVFTPLRMPGSDSNTFTLGAREGRTVGVSGGTPIVVKLVADRPIVAQGASSGFVPSVDGGMAGKEFLFALRNPKVWEQDTVYFTRASNEETEVVVQPLGGGPSYPFHMSSATSLNPDYTIGARSAIQAGTKPCDPQEPPSPRLPAEPALYRATVTSGGPVLLHYQAAGGVWQVPDRLGAPAGQQFWSAGDWSDEVDAGSNSNGPQCAVVPRLTSWYAAGLAGPTTAAVTSPDSPTQVDPPGSPSFPTPPPAAIPAAPALSPSRHAALADRPLFFESQDPMHLFVGQDPAQVGTGGRPMYPYASPAYAAGAAPSVHGPLEGASGGRVFTGIGDTLFVAPFDGTLVDVQVQRQRSTADDLLPLAKDSMRVVGAGAGNDFVRSLTAQSNLPVVALPMAATSGFFAAVPATAAVTLGPAEFRGYLLDLASANGLDPVAGSASPGTAFRYPLRVTNLGHKYDKSNLPDNVFLTVDTSNLPAGWQASIDVTSVSLDSGESRDVLLTVVPPQGALPGQLGLVVVRATSLGNDRVQDTLQAVTFIKQGFGVGLWFDRAEDGLKTQVRSIVRSDHTVAYALVAKNKGTLTDTIRFQLEGNEPGWQATLLAGGRDGPEVDEVRLPANGTAALTLLVRAPASAVEGLMDVRVTASSASAASARDAVRATAKLEAPSDVVLEVDDVAAFVLPGQRATFNLTLRNQGAGGADIALDLRSGGSKDWGLARVTVAGTDQPITQVSLTSGDLVRLQVTVPASERALAGNSTTLRLGAKSAGSPAQEAILLAKVRPLHALQVATPSLPVPIAAPGQQQAVVLRVSNGGNLDEHLAVEVGDLPPGWRLAGPREVLLPRGASQDVKLNLSAPAAAPQGLYNFTVRLASQDGNATAIRMAAAVGLIARGAPAGTATLEAQPGRPVRVVVPVRNEGNVPLRVRPTAEAQDGWLLSAGEQLLLPGEDGVAILDWTVPDDAPDGTAVRRARLEFEAPGGSPPPAQEVLATFDVGRAELRIVSAQAAAGPAGTLVHAVVENVGARAAVDFLVGLQSDGRTIDQVRVGDLPAGKQASMTLLHTGTGALRVVADVNGTVVEPDESDNAMQVAAKGQSAPAPVALATALLLLAFAALRRHRQA